jgi:hypothetical protein
MANKLTSWRPRIQVDLPEELANRANKVFPWGLRNEILRAIIEDLVSVMERVNPNTLAYMIINKQLTLFGGIADNELREVIRHSRN